MAILIAHGLRYILDKWYNLFPNNPYARISAFFPIGTFLGIMIIGGVSHFIFGYRYVPLVANEFDNDLTIIRDQLSPNDTLYVIDNPIAYNFYKVLEVNDGICAVSDTLPSTNPGTSFATLGKTSIDAPLSQIITSPKSENSDRIYLYNKE